MVKRGSAPRFLGRERLRPRGGRQVGLRRGLPLRLRGNGGCGQIILLWLMAVARAQDVARVPQTDDDMERLGDAPQDWDERQQVEEEAKPVAVAQIGDT